ncbi:hypothetical protein F2Q68_00036775 [Brassica cretica]|uniref:Uncharacterized protein n=1 Tax=Brassica cretica TaxID=69181 RepID=A0A8S9H432_BRACR|nr:hypothetical protein F2Q68_00036775 [Brassica cretica]
MELVGTFPLGDFIPKLAWVERIRGTIMTISKDRVKPSPTPYSWKLNEIFATGIVLGGYQAVMSVIFFWDKFGVRVVLGKKYSTEGGEYISQNVVRKFMELVGTFPLGDFIPKLAWVERIRGLDKKVEEVYKEDMLFGAATTIFALLEWTMTKLMRHPECMKKLKDEIHFVSTHNLYVTEQEAEKMSYLNLVIKEALRLHPGVPIAPRQLSEDVKVLINIWAIQRDVSAWGQDAEELRPGRHLDTVVDFQGQNLKFIPFGSGRRQCPGSGYVVALVEVTLANLV